VEIATVGARTLRLPLERPIRTSNLTIDVREFVLVEVSTTDGLSGHGFGFTRGGLLAETIATNLAPLLVGTDARLIEAAWERMYQGTRYLGRKGLLMRALSAVDIALWDLRGKALGAPVWALFGGYADRVDAYVAGGYYGPASDPSDVFEEFRRYRDDGYRGAKVNAGGLPFDRDLERIEAAREGLGQDASLAVDFNGVLPGVREALRWADALAGLGVSMVEEPFLMDDVAALRAFHTRSPIDVAVGEDESGRWAFAPLLHPRALDVLRHDATLVGGISEWNKVAALGLAANVTLFPHWFPEVHVHLAAAWPQCRGVEFIDPATGVMNLHELMLNPLQAKDGTIEVPSAPGLGIEWAWDRIEAVTR
jgi:D-arabinonate dehydratase